MVMCNKSLFMNHDDVLILVNVLMKVLFIHEVMN